jgi:hypothetical protein
MFQANYDHWAAEVRCAWTRLSETHSHPTRDAGVIVAPRGIRISVCVR